MAHGTADRHRNMRTLTITDPTFGGSRRNRRQLGREVRSVHGPEPRPAPAASCPARRAGRAVGLIAAPIVEGARTGARVLSSLHRSTKPRTGHLPSDSGRQGETNTALLTLPGPPVPRTRSRSGFDPVPSPRSSRRKTKGSRIPSGGRLARELSGGGPRGTRAALRHRQASRAPALRSVVMSWIDRARRSPTVRGRWTIGWG